MIFNYSDINLTVRDDLKNAYQEAWRRLAQPGCWWTGAERVAIAAESRTAFDCELCQKRKSALSPYTVEGQHDHSGYLPDIAIDAIHRIITDQGRITKSWVDKILSEGLSEGHYVELLGVVVMVFSIDEFNSGIGAALEPLPEPISGEPSHYIPQNLESDTGFVPMIPIDKAIGEEADLWNKDGTGNVIRAMSLVPDAVRDLILLGDAQYIPATKMMLFGDSGHPLDRTQIELVAGRVSSLNECFY